MKTLAVLSNIEGIPANATIVERTAVRGIIRKDKNILLVHSEVNGDYKFPGGGVEAGETHIDTLLREVAEECGVRIGQKIRAYGKTVEQRRNDVDGGADTEYFRMTSHYYFAEFIADFTKQKLDHYEAELKFKPVWIPLQRAIAQNRRVMETGNVPIWTARETLVLESLLPK